MTRDTAADREREKRGAAVSVEVGPCPECDYRWKANPRANRAECPRCGANSDRGAEVPTVSVPDTAEHIK